MSYSSGTVKILFRKAVYAYTTRKYKKRFGKVIDFSKNHFPVSYLCIMKNKIAFLLIISGLLFTLFIFNLYYLNIDCLAMHSLSSSVNNLNHSYLLLFYSISIINLYYFHSYFPPIFGHKKSNFFPRFLSLRIYINFYPHLRIIFSFFQKYVDRIRHHIFHFKRIFISFNLQQYFFLIKILNFRNKGVFGT